MHFAMNNDTSIQQTAARTAAIAQPEHKQHEIHRRNQSVSMQNISAKLQSKK